MRCSPGPCLHPTATFLPCSADACAQVLGFHFYRCREDSSVQPPRPAKPAPPGLYLAAAKLVQVRWQLDGAAVLFGPVQLV